MPSLVVEAQVDEDNLPPSLQLGREAADRTPRSPRDRLDVQLDVIVGGVQADDVDLRKADQALEHPRRVGLEVAGELALGRHRGTLAGSPR